MGRYMPGSQSNAVMAQKRELAAQLLQRGRTTTQVAGQLRCSPFFVRRVRASMPGNAGSPVAER